MKIIIQSLNSNTPVSVIDDSLDLREYTEPTRSILEEAYLAGSYTIQDEVEPVLVERSPDWDAFMVEMDTQGLFMVGLTANFAVFTQIFNMLLAMRDKQSLATEDCIEWRNFKLMYTLGRSAFSSEQIAQVEAAMILANIPLIE